MQFIFENSFRLALAALVSAWSVCDAATIVVDQNGGADHGGIQLAIDAAADGDVVLVKAGEYEIDPMGLDIALNYRQKKITVVSEDGPELTILRGDVNFEANYTEESVFAGFTVLSGDVFCRQNSAPTLRDSIFERSGVWLEKSSPAITNCKFANCSRRSGALLCGSLSNPVVTNCTFEANSGRKAGATTVSAFAAPTFINCVFTNNRYQSKGWRRDSGRRSRHPHVH